MVELLTLVDSIRYKGTGKVDCQCVKVFSDGTDPAAQAGTREEVGKIG